MPVQSLISVIGDKSLHLSELEFSRLCIRGCYFLLARLLVTMQSDNVHKGAGSEQSMALTERGSHAFSSMCSGREIHDDSSYGLMINSFLMTIVI